MKWEIPGSPNEYPLAQLMRPWLISIGCFLPAFAALLYTTTSILDRYVTRLFLSSFLMCTGMLTIIFILGDFAENASDLGSFANPFTGTIRFYLLQLPMILNLILPYTLLLGVLWTMTKLSSSSEITGMLQSGRSLMRLCIPVLAVSCIAALYFGIFGFHWSPNATLYRKLLFSSLGESRNLELDPQAQATRYRNDTDNRIWNIRIPPSIDEPGAPLEDVHIEQFSNPGQLSYEIFAEKGWWHSSTLNWTFENAIKRTHVPVKELTDIPYFDEHIANHTVNFKETPWQLISSSLNANTQGTPEILNQLAGTTLNAKQVRILEAEFHSRIARIFSCIILALIAIPSAVTFQRRSAMKGIGIAIFLAAAMLFLNETLPALAIYGLMPSWLGAWLPNIIYGCIAVYLYTTKLAMRSPIEWLKTRGETRALISKERQAGNQP